MKNLFFAAGLAALSGCGGTGDAIQQVPAGTPAQSFLANGNVPVLSSGFAKAGDSLQNIPVGTTANVKGLFGIRTATSQPVISIETLTITKTSATTISATLKGQTYLLTVDPFDPSYFDATIGNKIVEFYPYYGGTFGDLWDLSIFDTGANSISGSLVLLGHSTDPAVLQNLATANYQGVANLNAFSDVDGNDSATGTVSMAMDFANGTFTGNISATDPFGDGNPGSGGVPNIDFTNVNATITNGRINGNALAANLSLAPGSVGMSALPSPGLQGQIFGDTGQEALGFSFTNGTTTTGNPGSVYIDFAAQRQ